jgi:DNA-binding CsgD family transcriptional regulator
VHTDDEWLTDAARAVYATLSPREQAVLLAAARGAEDKEIAADLGCTLSTVRTLWQRTYKKTHTASRRRLIAKLWAEACQRASCHFLNDVTEPLESPTMRHGHAFITSASAVRQLRRR